MPLIRPVRAHIEGRYLSCWEHQCGASLKPSGIESIVSKGGGLAEENCRCSDGGLAERNCQHCVVYDFRIREVTSFPAGEGGLFIPDNSGEVDVDRYRSLAIRFESLDPYNR